MAVRRNDPYHSHSDVIIIGAGASGLFCASECGKRGRSVRVLDHRERMGSKILVSGGGHCNFTNLNVDAEHYFSENPHFCRSALARFTPRDMMSLLRGAGIAYSEKESGKLFCVTSARRVLDMLGAACTRSGVEILLSCRVKNIRKTETFTVATDRGTFRSTSLVIATGGLSCPGLGATGFGHTIARQFGLRITDLRPALVPLVFSGRDRKHFQALAGISFEATVACGGERFSGGILFTHRGISGPAVLDASSCWKPGVPLSIDLLPGKDLPEVFKARRHGRMELRTMLSRFLPKRFAQTWCGLFAPSRPIAEYSDRELRDIAARLHAWELRPFATEGYKTAEVTAGGVDTKELSSKTMEATRVPGLYFIGEVLDMTGRLGGYNLHWAWASGHAAGQYA